MTDDRIIEITVVARYPVQKIVDDYPDACGPDGGYTGTLEDYIDDHVRGFVDDMTMAASDLEYSVSSRIGDR